MSDCTFHSIVSIYSCFCCGCDINMHSRRVRRRSAVVLCGREPARQAALRIRKQDPLADGLRRLHRNYPSERSCLRNVKPLSRSLFDDVRCAVSCDIDLHDRTTLVSFSAPVNGATFALLCSVHCRRHRLFFFFCY